MLGTALLAGYEPWPFLAVGAFLRFDAGSRRAGRFSGFDADGRTQVVGEVGGAARELWLGPFARVGYRYVFAELGYGAYVRRWDDARTDLATQTGARQSPLSTLPQVAWLFTLMGALPLTPSWGLTLRIEYRIRYYDRRGGEKLSDDIVHGTQNLSPFVGVAYHVDLIP